MQGKKKALGRGLSAILESPETDITSRDISGEYVVGAVAHVPIEQIVPNPFQPRTFFSEPELEELKISIKEQGIIQPITVRKMGYDKYQLISGERRMKAAKLAGFTEIPAYIRVANDEQMLELALVENIQRSELNPIEIGISFQRLMEECKLNQDELSKKVGKDRSTVANYVRLLRLPSEIQIALRDGQITMGHARALLSITDVRDQLIFLDKILEKKLSVRQVEDMVRNFLTPKAPRARQETAMPSDLVQSVKESLNRKLNTRVQVKFNTSGKGSIIIPFHSDQDLERIVSKLEG